MGHVLGAEIHCVAVTAFCLSANSGQLHGAKSLASLASIKGLAKIVGRVVKDLLMDTSWLFPNSSGV